MGYLPYQLVSRISEPSTVSFRSSSPLCSDSSYHQRRSPPHPIATTKASIERQGMATMGFFKLRIGGKDGRGIKAQKLWDVTVVWCSDSNILRF